MVLSINLSKKLIKFVIVWVISNFFVLSLFGQIEVKMIQIGSLHGWFADKGCEVEQGRQKTLQQDGLRWPAYFQKQDCQAAKGFWIGVKNFTDANGKAFPIKVVSCGPRGQSGLNQFFTKSYKMTAKLAQPSVYVDNTLETYVQNYVNDVDPNQLPDRIINDVVNTSIGIEMTRKIIAFSQQDNDNYFIYDYTFKNTGDIYGDGSKILNQTLNGVYFYWQYRYAAGMEGCEYTANATTWGINATVGTRGDGSNPTGLNEDLRCQYEYMGKYSGVSFDCIGGPYIQKAAVTGTYNEPYNGHLGSTQHVGVVTIHADKSPADTTDDLTQPSTTSYEPSDDPLNQNDDAGDSFNDTKMGLRYAWMSKGHLLPRHSDKIGTGNADGGVGGSGGVSVANGFGPYTLKPGESIHIVMAEGVAGLSRDMVYNYGSLWYNKLITDAQKDTYVFTGADSLFKTFRKAIDSYKTGYKIPQPPPPPDRFEVISGGDRITLKWTGNAEKDPTFSGYRIYRADSTWDNRKYKLIYECGKNTSNTTIVNTIDDRTPVRGYSYYYYIQSIGDGSNNKGIQLVSNRQYTQTYDPAYLRRMAGADTAMQQIRVVPNPYNINSNSFQYKGERDKIMFLNIPGQCTIKIYSERGDLIRTLNHSNGSGDEPWDLITSSKQFVASGIYIVYFETPNGNKAFRKFVVIR